MITTRIRDRYIVPRFGSLRLSEITKSRVRTMIAELKTKGLGGIRSGLRCFLSGLFSLLPLKRDVDFGESCKRSPAKSDSSIKTKREARSMEPEEATGFLQAALDFREYFPIFPIALRAGLRQGEASPCDGRTSNSRKLINVERRWYRSTFDLPEGNRTRSIEMSGQLRGHLLRLFDQKLREAAKKRKGLDRRRPSVSRRLR